MACPTDLDLTDAFVALQRAAHLLTEAAREVGDSDRNLYRMLDNLGAIVSHVSVLFSVVMRRS